MSIFLPQAAPKQSFSSRLGAGLGQGISEGLNKGVEQGINLSQQMKLENAKQKSKHTFLENLFNGKPSGAKDGLLDLSPEQETMLALEDPTSFNAYNHLKKSKLEAKEKKDTLKYGLETLNVMKDIKEKGNLGRGSAVKGFFGGQAAKDRAEYEQLGRSLIPLVAAGVPIRNQREFDEYKKVLTDPSAQDAQIEGAISGLERLLKNKLKEEGHEEEKIDKEAEKITKRVKFDIRNPEHKAKRDQLMKKFKGDRKKVEEILLKEFE